MKPIYRSTLLLLSTLMVSGNSYSQDEFPVLEGPFFGQKPPGLTPEVFAPGIVSIDGRYEEDGKANIYWVSTEIITELKATSLTNPGVAEVEETWRDDNSPSWSPDGERIAFASNRSGNMQIYVMNKDGSNVSALTSGDAINNSPSWSPDGTKIAFCSDRDGNREIYLMDADGKNPVNLTRHPAPDCDTPGWSPDGKMLTFVSARNGDWQSNAEDNFDVYVMNSDGSDQRRLTQNRGYDLSTGQSWTPDGKHIIFCSSGDEPWIKTEGASYAALYAKFDIYQIDVDGQNQSRLTFTYGEDSYPNVSPNGQEIYYVRLLVDSGTNYDIYKMTRDGKTISRIIDLPGNEGPTTWSPDGKKIAYAVVTESSQSIYVADANGSNSVQISNLKND